MHSDLNYVAQSLAPYQKVPRSVAVVAHSAVTADFLSASVDPMQTGGNGVTGMSESTFVSFEDYTSASAMSRDDGDAGHGAVEIHSGGDLFTSSDGLVPSNVVNAIGRDALVVVGLPKRMGVRHHTGYGASSVNSAWPDVATVHLKLYAFVAGRGSLATPDALQDCFLSVPSAVCAQLRYGDTVSGATIEVALLSGTGVVDPGAEHKQILTTDANGHATFTIETGHHPGLLKLRIKIVTNPANPWNVAEMTHEIDVRPDLAHDDDAGADAIEPRLVAHGTLPSSGPPSIGIQGSSR